MENSVIVSFVIHIYWTLKESYKHSRLKGFIDAFMRGLESMQQKSMILHVLGKESKLGRLFMESIFYRAVIAPIQLLKKLLELVWHRLKASFANSSLITGTDRVLSNLFNYSLRTYGAVLFALIAVEGILWFMLEVNEFKYIAVRGILLLAAGILLLLDMPVAALFKNSVLYGFVEKGFADHFKPYEESQGIRTQGLPILLLIGAVLGIVAYLIPVKLFMMAAVGAAAGIVILWRYEVGVFLSAGFAALLPTSALFLLMTVTIISFGCSWVAGKLPKYKATPIDALVVLFFVVLCYSTLTSYFIADSIKVLAVHGLMLAFYFVLTRSIDSRYKLYLLTVLLLISATLTSLYGIYQYFGGSATIEAWVDTAMFEDIQSRVGSTFSNPNILGEYLIMMIPLCLSMLWYKKPIIYKGIFIAMLGIMGACMIFTFSRGAWLGLMLAMVAFFIVRDKRLFALFLVALLIMPFVLPPSVTNRFTSIGNLQDTSSSYRMSILLGSLRMAQDYWLTGVGLGSQGFKAIYPKYSLAAAYAHHSHNIYLQIILELGIAGAVVFMLLILVFIRASLAYRSKTRDGFLSTLILAACAGIGGYLVQGLVENIWYNYRILQTFWVVLALGLCAIKLTKGEVQTDD